MTRRVAITGIGAITPIGIAAAGLWAGIRAERSAVRELTRFDPSIFRSHIAAEVNDFVPTDHLEQKRAKRLDRFGQFSVATARLAIEDCGARSRARGQGAHRRDDGHRARRHRLRRGAGRRRSTAGSVRDVDPMLALTVFAGASSCNLAIEFGVQGPNSTNGMSCASGTIAIGDAFRQIRDGYADVMLAGGAEAPLWPLCYGAFSIIRAMSTRNDAPASASRPFDKDRDGFVMGEGAAVLVLEEYGAREGARRAHLRRDLRLRDEQRRVPHDRAAPRRLAGRAQHAARARRRARDAPPRSAT